MLKTWERCSIFWIINIPEELEMLRNWNIYPGKRALSSIEGDNIRIILKYPQNVTRSQSWTEKKELFFSCVIQVPWDRMESVLWCLPYLLLYSSTWVSAWHSVNHTIGFPVSYPEGMELIIKDMWLWLWRREGIEGRMKFTWPSHGCPWVTHPFSSHSPPKTCKDLYQRYLWLKKGKEKEPFEREMNCSNFEIR